MLRGLIAVLLCSATARAGEIRPLIDRAITVPQGKLDLTLHGTYSDWTASGSGPDSVRGESLAFGLDVGATDVLQFGLAIALPVHPGAAFGSLLGSAEVAVDRSVALRVDGGYEKIGFHGEENQPGGIFRGTSNRYFSGIGAGIKVPIGPTLAFVTGHTGAIRFGHYKHLQGYWHRRNKA